MRSKSTRTPNLRLRQAREQRGWSQGYLAEQIGTNSFTVSRWELGQALPRPYFRQQLCKLFGLSPQALGFLASQTAPGPAASEAPVQASLSREAGAISPVPLLTPLLPPRPGVAGALIGRAALLAHIKKHLLAGQSQTLWALQGLPGVGKTALAAALAYDPDVQAAYPDGILWAGLGHHPQILDILGRWGRWLGLSATDLARLTSLSAWAEGLRGLIGTRHMLLILDDAWSIEAALACQVGGPNSAHLLTTRFADLALSFAGGGMLPVPELTEGQGVELLARLAPQVVEAESEAAEQLVQAVGGLPLGLVLLGKQLQLHSFGGQPRRVRAALERLQQRSERLRVAQPQAPAEVHPSLPAETPLSLQASIGLSDATLSPEARAMLRTLALFPPKPNSFSEEAALAVSEGNAETLDALLDAGLVESAGAGRYRLHQTIADYARLAGGPEEALERLGTYFVAFVEANQQAYSILDQEAGNVLAALDALFARGYQTLLLVRGVLAFRPFLETRGWYTLLQEHLGRAADAARALGDTQMLGATLLQLGNTYQRQGAYAHAETMFEEALRLAQQHQQHDTVSAALYALGTLAGRRGDYAQAEEYMQAGFHLARQQGFWDQLPGLLTGLGNLANNRGAYTQAEGYFQEGLALARQLDQPERISALLTNLGILAEKRGQLPLAQTCYQEALVIARHLGHRERIIGTLINMGSLLSQSGDFRQAEAYLQEGLMLARQHHHQERLAFLLANLGSLATMRGDLGQAESYLQEGLALARQLGHRELIGVLLHDLGELARQAGDYTRAEVYLQEGQDVAASIPHRLLLITLLEEWGHLHLAQQQHTQAGDAFTRALHLAREEGHQRSIAQALYGLAQVAQAEGATLEAQRLGQESLACMESIGYYQAAEVRQWLAQLSQTSGQRLRNTAGTDQTSLNGKPSQLPKRL